MTISNHTCSALSHMHGLSVKQLSLENGFLDYVTFIPVVNTVYYRSGKHTYVTRYS